MGVYQLPYGLCWCARPIPHAVGMNERYLMFIIARAQVAACSTALRGKSLRTQSVDLYCD